MSMSLTAPSISIWNTTRDEVARSDGELLTSMASVEPDGSNWYVSGAPDARWDDDALGELHALAHAGRLEKFGA